MATTIHLDWLHSNRRLMYLGLEVGMQIYVALDLRKFIAIWPSSTVRPRFTRRINYQLVIRVNYFVVYG